MRSCAAVVGASSNATAALDRQREGTDTITVEPGAFVETRRFDSEATHRAADPRRRDAAQRVADEGGRVLECVSMLPDVTLSRGRIGRLAHGVSCAGTHSHCCQPQYGIPVSGKICS